MAYNVHTQQPGYQQYGQQQAYYGANPGQVQLNMGGAAAPPPPPGTAVAWMNRPQQIPNCPPGLEYLTLIDGLKIEQIPSLMEAFTGWDTNNKYVIKNKMHQQVYYAMEDTDTCMRICCGAQRGFKIHIVDNMNQEVMVMSREFKCCAGCCWCAGCCGGCAHEVVIEAPAGNVIGYVRQKGSCWKPNYAILDQNHQPILKLAGPCCILDGPCCPCDNDFKLITQNEQEIGVVKKEYAGFIREMVTTADRFSIDFPMDLDVKVKATLIGALFLIDFMFFENKQNNNNNR